MTDAGKEALRDAVHEGFAECIKKLMEVGHINLASVVEQTGRADVEAAFARGLKNAITMLEIAERAIEAIE